MADKVTETHRDGSSGEVAREWVGEVPVALEFNGLSYAVMMATPQDLADFARGFVLTEGLAKSASDVGRIDIAQVDEGWIVRTSLAGIGVEQLTERVRRRVAESSCGLCGIEDLHALAKPLPLVATHSEPEAKAIFAALDAVHPLQHLNRATGAAHGAAFAKLDGSIVCVREDVGRHNAMDKLIGALAKDRADMGAGFFISTARCSYEIVEKVVHAGGANLVTISLPTSMAVERAKAAGLSLFCLARQDSFLKL